VIAIIDGWLILTVSSRTHAFICGRVAVDVTLEQTLLGGTYDIDIIILVGVAVLSCGRQISPLTDCWWRWRFCSTRTFYIESSIPGIRLLYHHRGQLVTCDTVPAPSAMYHSLRYGCYLTLCLCISLCVCQSVSIFCVRGGDDFVCFSMRRGLVNLRFQLRQEGYMHRDLYGASSVGMLQPVSHLVCALLASIGIC
jgi:hypothetical protein